jgi:peptide-methionine (R)-S-oxide reductase
LLFSHGKIIIKANHFLLSLHVDRRRFLISFFCLAIGSMVTAKVFGRSEDMPTKIEKIDKSENEWRKLLTPQQFNILREEGTEKPFSSPLNENKKKGKYVCAGCELPMFTSEMKYDSGTGWPSFYTSMEGRVETKVDFKLIFPRTEYHCARCGGHQGHVFKDGPPPTGQRWCNNGLALKFIPA